MQLADNPTKIAVPWADSGLRHTIPDTPPENTALACWPNGFPTLTFTPKAAGGKGPDGYDTNGVLFALSALLKTFSAGGAFVWSSDFATAIGGYPKGSRVLDTDGINYWRNTADNNTANPTSTDSGWILETGGKWEEVPVGAFTPDVNYIYRVTHNVGDAEAYSPLYPKDGVVRLFTVTTPDYLVWGTVWNESLSTYQTQYLKYNGTDAFEVWASTLGGSPSPAHITYLTITKLERKKI